MTNKRFEFPPNFRWGCATSAYQVEGDSKNNNWYLWEQGTGNIVDGARSGLACNWWNDAESDLARAAAMGQNTHRLSIEWSRIEVRENQWDESAIERYRQILRFMHEHSIEPMITLHHFTTPLWVLEQGGWENTRTISLFERFTKKIMAAFSEYCHLWCTINEPMIYAVFGYAAGGPRSDQTPQHTFPPGKRNFKATLTVIENLFRGHAIAYHAIHRDQPEALVGIAHHLGYWQPLRRYSPFDQLVTLKRERLMNQAGLLATLHGRLPRLFGFRWIAELKHTCDFIGVNYYGKTVLKFDILKPETIFTQHIFPSGSEISDLHFSNVYPEGLYHVLKRLSRYNKPIFITENGIPDADDDRRPAYIISHVHQLWRAIHHNIPILGYYHWTLVDNFEWAEAWNLRFGLIELDPVTQERKMRRSGELYQEICTHNGITRTIIEHYAPELLSIIR